MIIWSNRKRKTAASLIAVIFVILVGTLGYLYVLNYKAEVATAPATEKTIKAQTMAVPTVDNTKDLDSAIQTLDAASVDNLSNSDLDTLQAQLDSF